MNFTQQALITENQENKTSQVISLYAKKIEKDLQTNRINHLLFIKNNSI